MKAFVIGFPKSGTSTLQDAFTRSGLKSAHWRIKEGGYVGQLIYRSFLNGRDPLEKLADFDVIAQADVCVPGQKVNCWPQLDFSVLTAIRKHHPECVFILNRRPSQDIASSILRWNDFSKRLEQSDIPGLPRGYGTKAQHLVQWIDAHCEAARLVFKDDPNFLELDILDPEAPEKLGAAIKTPILWWGQSNVNRRQPSAA
jgi:hypothetical protein